MRAVMTCVGYSEELTVTLPYNRHHFESVLVVTTPADAEEVRRIAEPCGADVFVTDAFYQDGAAFNKFAALEEGLDWMGRRGWLAILDADVLWPKESPGRLTGPFGPYVWMRRGNLYTPRRRMFALEPGWRAPPETDWKLFPLHQLHARLPDHFSGYTMLFHAADPHLGPPPWHRLDLPTAGAGDTYFQEKWPVECRIRPPWEVLHLGRSGVNWRGRT